MSETSSDSRRPCRGIWKRIRHVNAVCSIFGCSNVRKLFVPGARCYGSG